MTVCNMSVEGGAKAGFIAPDDKVYAYLKGPSEGSEGQKRGMRRGRYWDTLRSDDGAKFRPRNQTGRRQALPPLVDLGNEPGAGLGRG